MTQPPTQPRPDATASEGAAAAPLPMPKTLRSDELFAGRKEVFIQHGQAIYRLRITSQGRLILTK